MELYDILEIIHNKFKNSNEYNLNHEFFIENYNSFSILAINYICTNLKSYDLTHLLSLDPKYRHFLDKDINGIEFLSDDSINRFILNRKIEIVETNNFYIRFMRYLAMCKPDWFKWLNDSILTDFKKRGIPKESLLKPKLYLGMIGAYLCMYKNSDIFEIMSSDDVEMFKKIINNCHEIIADKNNTLLAYELKLKNLSYEKPQPITRKENLVKLLDFCSVFLAANPKAKPEKIIKAFEDETVYFGKWKSWETFFIEYYETIKTLTDTPFSKKMDGLFVLNCNRIIIDALYKVIEKHKFL